MPVDDVALSERLRDTGVMIFLLSISSDVADRTISGSSSLLGDRILPGVAG